MARTDGDAEDLSGEPPFRGDGIRFCTEEDRSKEDIGKNGRRYSGKSFPWATKLEISSRKPFLERVLTPSLKKKKKKCLQGNKLRMAFTVLFLHRMSAI